MQLPKTSAQWVTAEEASNLAKIPLKFAAIHFPEGGHMNLPEVCRRELAEFSHLIAVQSHTEVTCIERIGSRWLAWDKDQKLLAEADEIVFAAAHSLSNFIPAHFLPLRKVRGQAAFLKRTSNLKALQKILCFDGFMTPALPDGSHFVGATYDNENYDLSVRESENMDLLQRLVTAVPELSAQNLEISKNWVELRTNVPGMEPVIGRLSKMEGQPLVATAFSSRGSIYAPIAGEILASEIFDEPLPIERDLYDGLSPDRFR